MFLAARRALPAALVALLALVWLTPALAQDRPVVKGETRRTLDEYLSRLERFGFTGGALAVRGTDVLLSKSYGLADRARHIVAGSTTSNLREVIKRQLAAEGRACRCIRCREVRGEPARVLDAVHSIEYETPGGRELFLSVDTDAGKLAGFLRLSLPADKAAVLTGIDELRGAAIIREVHVDGPLVELGRSGIGRPQHSGLGVKLLREAEDRARAAGYDRLAVISAIGTRHYYLKHGFQRGELYLIKSLD